MAPSTDVKRPEDTELAAGERDLLHGGNHSDFAQGGVIPQRESPLAPRPDARFLSGPETR